MVEKKGRTGQNGQKSTHWQWEFKRTGNSVSFSLGGREVFTVAYSPSDFQSGISKSYVNTPPDAFTEDDIDHARRMIKELGGPQTRKEALKALAGAYQIQVTDYAKKTAEYIELNLTDLACKLVDLITTEAKVNSGRVVDLARGKIPTPIPSPTISKKLRYYDSDVRDRSGPAPASGPKSDPHKILKQAKALAHEYRTQGKKVTQETISEGLGKTPRALQKAIKGRWAEVKKTN